MTGNFLKLIVDDKFFDRLFSHDPFDLPKAGDCLPFWTAEIMYHAPLGWFDHSHAILIHLCYENLNEAMKITAEANGID